MVKLQKGFKSVEEQQAYYRKKYKERKRQKQDYGQKVDLLIKLTQVVKKTPEMIAHTPKKFRSKVYRDNFCSLSGSMRIPLEYLHDNLTMCEYVAQDVGEGEFIIMIGVGGYSDNKRAKWGGILRFISKMNLNGEIKVTKCTYTKKGRCRMSRMWFRKANIRTDSDDWV